LMFMVALRYCKWYDDVGVSIVVDTIVVVEKATELSLHTDIGPIMKYCYFFVYMLFTYKNRPFYKKNIFLLIDAFVDSIVVVELKRWHDSLQTDCTRSRNIVRFWVLKPSLFIHKKLYRFIRKRFIFLAFYNRNLDRFTSKKLPFQVSVMNRALVMSIRAQLWNSFLQFHLVLTKLGKHCKHCFIIPIFAHEST